MFDYTNTQDRTRLTAALRKICGKTNVIDDPNAMRPYETDGLSAHPQLPLLVVLPETVGQVQQVLAHCYQHGVNITPRGAGTSLSGGAVPIADGVLLSMMKFNRILEIDLANRAVVAQPGVTNLAISEAVRADNFFYAPDPSSQLACSIGGNVAENSGGVHCLKYGLTTNNLLGVQMVLIDGQVIRLGGKIADGSSLDLLGVICGSEGLLGIVTEATLRILPRPEATATMIIGFAQIADAAACVADIIAAGVVPGGVEFMDKAIIHATEEHVHAGYPLDVEALLLVEIDGTSNEVQLVSKRVQTIAKDAGASTVEIAADAEQAARFWAGRKAAFPALSRLAPDFLCMDGSIPRGKLVEALARIEQLAQRHGLQVANAFHAGDGNLHPVILYDAGVTGELEKAEALGSDILRACVDLGGALTGEHGVGIEKKHLMPEVFSEQDLTQQQRLKCAFDEQHLLNPGKVFPTLHRCAEIGFMHVHGGVMSHPELPRF